MRYILWQNHKTLIRNFIFLAFGIYLGMFLCLYFHGQKLDILIDKNAQLSQELESTKNAYEICEKENKNRNKQLIRSVKFNFQEKLNPFDETELLKTLVEETHFLIGKRVDDVGKSPEFLYQLLNGKIFIAKDKSFETNVRIIYIQSTIDIWLSVKEKKT